MKLIIAGSRDISLTADAIHRALTVFMLPQAPSCVLCGGARGPDASGAAWATQNRIPVKYFLPEWNLFGKKAGPIRNAMMANEADALIAFWDRQSRGTLDMYERMVRLQKPARLFDYCGDALVVNAL